MKPPKNLDLKQDRFSKARGGKSTVLLITCKKCGEDLAVYQKDGPGPLKRLYLDRLVEPTTVAGELVCKSCKKQVGIPYIYRDEKRPALLVEIDSVVTKVIPKNTYGR